MLRFAPVVVNMHHSVQGRSAVGRLGKQGYVDVAKKACKKITPFGTIVFSGQRMEGLFVTRPPSFTNCGGKPCLGCPLLPHASPFFSRAGGLFANLPRGTSPNPKDPTTPPVATARKRYRGLSAPISTFPKSEP